MGLSSSDQDGGKADQETQKKVERIINEQSPSRYLLIDDFPKVLSVLKSVISLPY